VLGVQEHTLALRAQVPDRVGDHGQVITVLAVRGPGARLARRDGMTIAAGMRLEVD
jgi:hypothetical protein